MHLFQVSNMSGLDLLLSESLEKTIRENLGEKASQKIEDRLFEKYGISLTQSIEQFQKIDAVLREFFGAGADGLEKKFLETICKSKNKAKGSNWLSLEDISINQTILESYGDDDKTQILNCVSDEPKIISEILAECKIPQTSGYRKINSLIKNGLLVVDGSIVSHDGRQVSKYRTLFDNVRINIVKNKITVDILLDRPNYNDSTVLQVIFTS